MLAKNGHLLAVLRLGDVTLRESHGEHLSCVGFGGGRDSGPLIATGDPDQRDDAAELWTIVPPRTGSALVSKGQR